MEVGNGVIYNRKWNSQICDLDAASNSIVSQFVNIESDNHCGRCMKKPFIPGAPRNPLPAFIPKIPNLTNSPFKSC